MTASCQFGRTEENRRFRLGTAVTVARRARAIRHFPTGLLVRARQAGGLGEMPLTPCLLLVAVGGLPMPRSAPYTSRKAAYRSQQAAFSGRGVVA
jgi:hypothetical protein